MSRFEKAYVEITNACNLNCPFCPKTRRDKKFMTTDEFRIIVSKLRPYTDYLYLHVMGEPLLHPKLGDMLAIAGEIGLKVNITTNGTLLEQQRKVLLDSTALRKISFSVHSFEANPGVDGEKLLNTIIDFSKKAVAAGLLIEIRLWNLDGTEPGMHRNNETILSVLRNEFQNPWKTVRSGYEIVPHLFLTEAKRFEWPEMNAELKPVTFCYGLRNQIGVLSDGTVVPCCLDHEGDIPLGNLLKEDPETILNSSRAKKLYEGFSTGKPTEELCKRCEYASRF